MNAQQLKNSILQEAIEGRLVPQDPNDEPASVLLERIREEKRRLVKEGKLKKKDLEETPIQEDEIPFEIPDSWEWVRFLDVFQILNGDRGKNYPSKSKLSTSGIPFISALNLQNNSVLKDDRLLCLTEEQYNKLGNGKLHLGDMVVCIRGSLGKHGIYPFNRGAIASSLVIVRQYVFFDLLFKYLNIYLDSPLFFEEIKKYNNGTAQPNLAAESLKLFLIPLPPLAEQKRIVAKIEELLPKVEEYGKAQDALDKLNAELPERLKKSILQEAISGRLVPQDPNDEPASILLDKIRAEKAKLVKEGKLKKKDLEETPIQEDEIPFDIPDSWEWVRISDISESFIGLTYKPTDVSTNGWIVLRSSNIQEGVLDYNDLVKGNVEVSEKLRVRENDIIICARNGSKKLVGKSALVREVNEPTTFGAFMAICRTQFYEYIAKYLLSPLFFQQLRKDSDTTTINQLTQKNFNRYLVPLPPLAEQKRIVAKIEQLLGEIEKLK